MSLETNLETAIILKNFKASLRKNKRKFIFILFRHKLKSYKIRHSAMQRAEDTYRVLILQLTEDSRDESNKKIRSSH